MTDRELMQQALDALEHALSDDKPYIVQCKDVAEALRARLAQPEQEPVALQDDEIYDAAFSAYCKGENSRELFRIMWGNRLTCSIGWDREELKSFARNIAALYTAPPQREWQGLTTQEIADETDIATSSNKDIFDLRKAFWCGARWAEEKLKQKNA